MLLHAEKIMMSKKYDKKLDMYMFMSIGFLIEKHNIVTCAFVFFLEKHTY
jgi:hypothetical protein